MLQWAYTQVGYLMAMEGKMPVFEYRCPRCGLVFDHFWRGPERREELRCPACGADQVEKIVSRFGTKASYAGSSYSGASCAPTGG